MIPEINTGVPRRDAGIQEAIDYFNQYFKKAKGDHIVAWSMFKPGELKFVEEEIARCAGDFRYYAANYHVVATKSEGLKTLHPFWDSQEIFYFQVVKIRLTGGKIIRLVIMKARQLGISTVCQGMLFHNTIFTEACNSLVVAQDPDQADYLFGMSRTAYDSLPWWMRPESRYESKGRYLQFERVDDMERTINPGLRSNIFVAAANKMTGVSVGKGIRTCHMSELSDWADAGKTLGEHIFPAMEGSTDLLALMESTARGRGGKGRTWFEFWKGAVNGENGWTPIFIESFRLMKQYSLPCKAVFELTPEETAMRRKVQGKTGIVITDEHLNWRREKIREFVQLQGDDSKFFQEYPSATWMEAFQGTGLCAFNKKKLQSILDLTCCDPQLIGEISLESDNRTPKLILSRPKKGALLGERKGYGNRLWVWELPEEGEGYYMAADVALGNGGDFSTAQIIRIGRAPHPDFQVAEWRGWIGPTEYGRTLAALGYWYNKCEVACEFDGIGNVTNVELFRKLEYPQVYRWKHVDKIKNFLTDYFGWLTNHKTRPVIIVKLREATDNDTIVIRSEQLIEEMMDFASEYEGGRYEGQDSNDDLAMAMMIANYCAHDSDWGIQQAGRPKDPKKEHVDMNIRQRTEWSPIYSRPGELPHQMHTRLNIPAEAIGGPFGGLSAEVGMHEGALVLFDADSGDPDGDWRSM